MDFATLILREVPPSRIRIDLNKVQVVAPFRGFALVPPGPHIVTVGSHSLWCWLSPGEVQVHQYHPVEGFRAETGVARATFTQLVRSGVINASLVPYNLATFFAWQRLTHTLRPADFTPWLPHTVPFAQAHTTFERELHHTHDGGGNALLAEFQVTFLRWLLHTPEDRAALRRWGTLLYAITNADEATIAAAPELFAALGGVMVVQFEQVGDSLFTAEHPITQGVYAFALRLFAANTPDLIDTGSRLRLYVAQRREWVG